MHFLEQEPPRWLLLIFCLKNKPAVFSQRPPPLHQAALAEELLHYFNYRGRRLLGKTRAEIGQNTIEQMEILVERSLEKSGFIRFRPR